MVAACIVFGMINCCVWQETYVLLYLILDIGHTQTDLWKESAFLIAAQHRAILQHRFQMWNELTRVKQVA